MKKNLTIIICCFLASFCFTNCKKDKPKCGCNDDEISNTITGFEGILSFYDYKKKWILSYHPEPGTVLNYFPCNTNQIQLKQILNGVNQSQVFQVQFSGKIKEPCPREDFGVISGVTVFNYIVIDSIKLN